MPNKSDLIQDYIIRKPLYASFAENISSLLESFLINEGINFQHISHRGKRMQNLREKILRKQSTGKPYHALSEIPDLAGVRVTVFFKDDLDRLAKVIEKEFQVHTKENVDITNMIAEKPKEFGYQSKHRVISLNTKRSGLEEYKRFKGLKCEIQIRTVLQHAWAEIEHDIGYKPECSEQNTKRLELTRLLSQNAALLEVADDNFVKIRELYQEILEEYRSSLKENNLNIPLNVDSAHSYFQRYPNKRADLYMEAEDYAGAVLEAVRDAKKRGNKTLNDFDHKSKK